MVRFTFKGVPPRWALRRAANIWLTHLLTISPKGTACHAKATRIKTGFQFEVELATPHGVFKTKSTVDENRVDRAEGDWQADAIAEAGDQITQAYQDFLRKYITDAGTDPVEKPTSAPHKVS